MGDKARFHWKIPLARRTFTNDQIELATECLRKGNITAGNIVKEFEEKFAALHKSENGIMVNSGSSANLLIFSTLKSGLLEPAWLKAGDEVIVPAISWATTVWPIIQLGMIPVIADADPETLNISPDSIEKVSFELSERSLHLSG